MKNIISFFFLWIILFAFVPVQADADNEALYYDCFAYILSNDNTAEVVRYMSSDRTVTIPDQLDGYSVTSIGDNAFAHCESLEKVSIPENASSLGRNAFYGCASLKEVVIPGSVTAIDYGTFRDCISLRKVIISDGITTIGDYAFMWCKSLAEIIIPESVTTIDFGAFYGCDSLTLTVESGSIAEAYAIQTSIPYRTNIVP